MTSGAGSLVLRLLVVMVAGWFRQSEQLILAYLREENRVLREQLAAAPRRVRFTDEQRRRLAVRAQPLAAVVLRELGTLVTPQTLLRWYRQLVATKYDGSRKRASGRRAHEGRAGEAGAPDGAR